MFGRKKTLDKKSVQHMKKPMGKTGEDGNQINRCMAIEKKIMWKTHSGLLGFTLDENSINLERETENTGRGGFEGGLMESTFDLEYDNKGNPNANPAPVDIPSFPPLCCSPHTFLVWQQETNVNTEEVAPAPTTDAARAALRKT